MIHYLYCFSHNNQKFHTSRYYFYILYQVHQPLDFADFETVRKLVLESYHLQ